jgi:hypothetical protein
MFIVILSPTPSHYITSIPLLIYILIGKRDKATDRVYLAPPTPARKCPRVDASLYQATIPNLSELRKLPQVPSTEREKGGVSMLQAQLANADLRGAQTSINDGQLWGGSEWSDNAATLEYLGWYRARYATYQAFSIITTAPVILENIPQAPVSAGGTTNEAGATVATNPANVPPSASVSSKKTKSKPLAVVPPEGTEIFSESEEYALALLAKCHYNAEMAKFLIKASLCAEKATYLDNLDALHLETSRSKKSRRDKEGENKQSWQNWLSKCETALAPKPDPTIKVLSTLSEEALALKNFEGSSIEEKDRKKLVELLNEVNKRKDEADRWIFRMYNMFSHAMERNPIREVEYTASLANSIRVLLPEVNIVRKMVRNGKELRERCKAVLEVNAHTSLQGLRLLHQQATNLPVVIPEEELIARKIAQVVSMQDRVIDIVSRKPQRKVVMNKISRQELDKLIKDIDDIDVSFDEVNDLRQLAADIDTWVHESQKLLKGKRSNLSVFINLLAEKDQFHVDLSEIASQLEEVVNQSNRWVAKLYSCVNLPSAPFVPLPLDQLVGAIRLLTFKDNDHQSQLLTTLAAEGDEISAIVAEHTILTAELKSRQWSSEVSEALVSETLLSLSEWKQFISRASSIHNSVASILRKSSPWKIEHEESVLTLVKSADEWVKQTKELMSSVTTIAALKELITESRSIRVNFRDQLSALRSRLMLCEQWVSRAITLLQTVGVTIAEDEVPSTVLSSQLFVDDFGPCDTSDMYMVDPFKSPDPAVVRNPSADLSVPSSSETPGGHESKGSDNSKLSIDVLYSLLNDSNPLMLSHKCVTVVKTMIESIESWHFNFDSVFRQSARKRDMKKIPYEDLVELMEKGLNLPVAVSEEIAAVDAKIKETKKWVEKARDVLEQTIVTTDEDHLLSGYEKNSNVKPLDSSVSTENTTPEMLRLDAVRRHSRLAAAAFHAGSGTKARINEILDGVRDLLVITSEEASLRLRLESIGWASAASNLLKYTENELRKDRSVRKLADYEEWKALLDSANSILAKEASWKEGENQGVDEGIVEEREEKKPTRKTKSKFKVPAKRDTAKKGSTWDDAMDIEPANHSDIPDESVVVATPSVPSFSKAAEIGGGLYCTLKFLSDEVLVAFSHHQSARSMLKSKDEAKPSFDDFHSLYTTIVDTLKCTFPEVNLMRNVVKDVSRWQSAAKAIIEGGAPLTLEETGKFCSEIEEFCCVPVEERKVMLQNLENGKRWEEKLVNSGIEEGIADVEVLKKLLQESSSILVDLSQYVSTLQQAVQVYCICRKSYSGFMVGCDNCDEWFHGPCIEMTKSKLKRQKTFQCIRCDVKKWAKSSLDEAKTAVHTILIAHRAQARSSSSTNVAEEKVAFLDQFFSTEKGQIVLSCLQSAATAIQNEIELLASNVNGAMKQHTMPSESLAALVTEATTKNLNSLPVITVVCKTVAKLKWVSKTLSIIGVERPTMKQWVELNTSMDEVEIVDENLTLQFQSIYDRAIRWKERAEELLAPKSGASVNQFKSMLVEAASIPLFLEDEKKMECVVGDGAGTYCGCGGFNDGQFMLVCDTCDEWFHGACVWVTEAQLNAHSATTGSDKYECPKCARKKKAPYVFQPAHHLGASPSSQRLPLYSFEEPQTLPAREPAPAIAPPPETETVKDSHSSTQPASDGGRDNKRKFPDRQTLDSSQPGDVDETNLSQTDNDYPVAKKPKLG